MFFLITSIDAALPGITCIGAFILIILSAKNLSSNKASIALLTISAFFVFFQSWRYESGQQIALLLLSLSLFFESIPSSSKHDVLPN
tara:strand:+ start:470 stop:730 length:261 start_codon:yes stop_codon:yes gene_type:complete